MPLFDLQPSIEGRRRVFVRAQLPLFLGTAVVSLGVLIGHPSSFVARPLLVGLLLIVLASLAALFAPWERYPVERLAVVAAADFVGVAFLRADLVHEFPSAGFLLVFPLLWIGYGFGRRFLVLAIAGALFTTALPDILSGTWPSNALGWVNILLLPVLTSAVAAATNTAAQQMLRSRRELARNGQSLTAALRQAQDVEIVSRAILDTVDAAVAFYGADDELVVANRNAHRTVAAVGFRLDTPPFAGEQVRQADRTTPIPLEEQIIPRALRGEFITNHMEWLGPEGNQTAILATSRQAFREDGVLLGTLIVAYDVTPLANAIAVREEFLTTVSHELRTPLTSIVGYTELISESLGGDADALHVAGPLAVVKRNADELLDRIGQLLTVSEKNIVLRLAEVDVAEVFGSACEEMSLSARSSSHDLRAEVAPDIRATIDPQRVRQVIENLLTNAIKYTPRGGTITASLRPCEPDPSSFEIVVSDTGIGMTVNDQRQAFDRFFRSRAARDGAIQGVGVGLSIVKEIVDAHGGAVAISSEPQRGTTVTVTLPRAPAEVAAVMALGADQEAVGTSATP